MKKENKKSGVSKPLMFIGGAALTVAGFIIIPPMMGKHSNKMYKSSLKKVEIDYDKMGPKFLPHGK